jgi:F-type H+-transporting ATPase subunit a
MKRFVFILLIVLLPAMPVFGQTEKKGETVNVQEVIFGHLKDSYEWHIITIGNKEISVSLPIIVHSINTGWHIFSSKHLKRGANYEGFQIGKVVEIRPDGTSSRPFDMSYTKIAFAITINSLLLLTIILGVGQWYKKHNTTDIAPDGFVGLIELLVQMVCDNIIKCSIGKDYKRYEPYLLTVFFFILLTNLMGLIPIFPAGANVTGNIAVTLFLSIMTFFAVNIFGNKEYWKDILWPDVPFLMKCPVPLMPVIEIFGIFTKPFALTVRLFANMIAGHSIILALTCVIFIFAKMGTLIVTPMSIVSVLFMVFMNILELLVAFIQAYVFTLLSAVFIGLSRQHYEKKEKVLTK